MEKKLKKFSLVCLIIAAILFIINYFFFHYVTDSGITLVKQEEAGKPFVANLIGLFATMFLATSAITFTYIQTVLKEKAK